MYDFQASCEIITGTTDAAPSVKMVRMGLGGVVDLWGV